MDFRGNDYDVSAQFNTTDPQVVNDEVDRIYLELYPAAPTKLLDHAFRDLTRLYRGEYPGYHPCDTAYHDVQCESCHGPGAEHVETPDASDHPLARVRVLAADIATGNIDTDTATVAGSCAECHSGAHHPFVDEWRQSAHARALYSEEDQIFIADESSSCSSCHEGRSVLRAWGVTTNYFERDSVAGPA